MRWDRLFADLEGEAHDAQADERDSLADDLRDESWASLGWRDLLAGQVTIEVAGLGAVTGEVVGSGEVIVMQSAGRWVALVPDAIVAITSDDGRAADVPPLRGARRQFLRALADDGSPVQVVRRDGSTVVGPVVAAGADFVQVAGAGRRVSLPWSAVAALVPQ